MKPNISRYDSMPSVWAGVGDKRKRGLRILPRSSEFFVHVTSRTAGQEFLFGDEEKQHFRRLMIQWAEFSGMTIVTHCLMDNHFHILLWVPSVARLDHADILQKLKGVWPEEKVVAWESFHQQRSEEDQLAMDAAVVERMGDLPEFMRVLKQSFTRWYNRGKGRKGTLWDARYRSVVVENNPLALMSVAAYVDLNPFRAGLGNDPMDYEWSGYGLACKGNRGARKGLDLLVRCARGHLPREAVNHRIHQLNSGSSWKEVGETLNQEHHRRAAPQTWEEVQKAYRVWLYHTGKDRAADPRYAKREKFKNRKGFDPVEVVAEYERQGEIPRDRSRMLHHRLRSFSRGAGIGSPGFLEGLMRDFRSCFGEKRKKAGRTIPGLSPGFQTLRQVD